MDIYTARWENACRIASKINDFIEKGYIIFNEDDEKVDGFIIREDRIFQNVNDNCSYIFFLNDKEFDNGYYTKIKEYNKQFKDWYCVHPKDYKKIF
jgi:hypothetical protein